MDADPDWCASALALTEALVLVDRVVRPPDRLATASASPCATTGSAIHVVPVDQRCLDRAAELAREQPLRTVDALHLAAADRLPPPVTFVTFDPRQIPVALALGFDVVSS